MRAYLTSRLRLQRRAFAATGLAVLLAVAFVVTALGATATLKGFLEDGAAPRAERSTVVATPDLRAETIRWATDADLAKVRALPGVTGVTAVRKAAMTLGWPDAAAPTTVESLPGAPGLAWYRVTAGRAPAATGEVLVDRRSADRLGVRPGDRLAVGAVQGRDLPAALVVSGLFTVDGPQPFQRTVLADGRDVAAWGVSDGETAPVEEVDVLASPRTDVAALQADVRSALRGYTVRTGQEAKEAAVLDITRDVDVLGRLVLGFTAVALVVAMIVIANTFAILLAQRSRELALLRCVGASRRQVRRATLVEAGLLGLGASVLGVATGVAVLVGAVLVLPSFADVFTGLRPVLGVGALVGPLVLGVVVTLLSAMVPIRRATKVAPLAAMRPETAAQVRRTSRVRLGAGAVVGLLGVALVAVAVLTGDTTGVLLGVAGGTFVVLAVVLAAPVLVPAVTRLVGAPLAAAGPVARIAVGNTRRNAARSAATSTAVFVGVCLISVLSVGAATTVRAVEEDLDRRAPLDVGITTSAEYTPESDGLPSTAVPAVAKATGIVAASGLRGLPVTFTKQGAKAHTPQVQDAVVGGDPAALRAAYRGDLPLADGLLLAPAPDEQAVGLNPAGAADGEKVVVRAGDRSVTLTLREVPNLPTVLVSAGTLDRLGAPRDVVAIWARARDGADPVVVSAAVDAALRSSSGLAGLSASGSAAGGVAVADYYDSGSLAQRASIVQVMDVLLLTATGLLGVALVISLVGIANTLSLSVIERARESAVSRAIGMTRRQLRAGLAVEALLLGGVGCLLGLVVGSVLGWAGASALLSGLTDVGGPVVPAGRVGALVAVALVAALLASVLPGRRAARVSPTQALAEA